MHPLVRASASVLVGILTAAIAAAEEPAPSGCHEYEGDAVSLLGTIRMETFPGKPNFLNVHRGDEPVSELVLELDEPFCVNAQPDREEGPLLAQSGVVRVQALMPIELPTEAELLGRLGERVWLHGKLIPPGSYYHFLPVLIQARRMTPENFERPEAPEVPALPDFDLEIPVEEAR